MWKPFTHSTSSGNVDVAIGNSGRTAVCCKTADSLTESASSKFESVRSGRNRCAARHERHCPPRRIRFLPRTCDRPRAGEITNEDRFRSETEANGVGIRCPSRGPTAHCSDTLGDGARRRCYEWRPVTDTSLWMNCVERWTSISSITIQAECSVSEEVSANARVNWLK